MNLNNILLKKVLQNYNHSDFAILFLKVYFNRKVFFDHQYSYKLNRVK